LSLFIFLFYHKSSPLKRNLPLLWRGRITGGGILPLQKRDPRLNPPPPLEGEDNKRGNSLPVKGGPPP